MSTKIYIIFWINFICSSFWTFLVSSLLADKTMPFSKPFSKMTIFKMRTRPKLHWVFGTGLQRNDYIWEMIVVSLRNIVISPWSTVARAISSVASAILTVTPAISNRGHLNIRPWTLVRWTVGHTRHNLGLPAAQRRLRAHLDHWSLKKYWLEKYCNPYVSKNTATHIEI